MPSQPAFSAKHVGYFVLLLLLLGFCEAAAASLQCVAEDPRVTNQWCSLNCVVGGSLTSQNEQPQLHPACDPLATRFPLCRCQGIAQAAQVECQAVDPRVTSQWCQTNCFAAGEGVIHPACSPTTAKNQTKSAVLCQCNAPGNCSFRGVEYAQGSRRCVGPNAQHCQNGKWVAGKEPCTLVGAGEVCVYGQDSNETVLSGDMVCLNNSFYLCNATELLPVGECNSAQGQAVSCNVVLAFALFNNNSNAQALGKSNTTQSDTPIASLSDAPAGLALTENPTLGSAGSNPFTQGNAYAGQWTGVGTGPISGVSLPPSMNNPVFSIPTGLFGAPTAITGPVIPGVNVLPRVFASPTVVTGNDLSSGSGSLTGTTGAGSSGAESNPVTAPGLSNNIAGGGAPISPTFGLSSTIPGTGVGGGRGAFSAVGGGGNSFSSTSLAALFGDYANAGSVGQSNRQNGGAGGCNSAYSQELGQPIVFCGAQHGSVNSSYSLCYFASEFECRPAQPNWIFLVSSNSSFRGFVCPLS